MADVRNRNRKESKLGRALSSEFARFLSVLASFVPRSKEPFAIPPEEWDEHTANLRGVLEPALIATYLDQSGQMVDGSPIGVDWALVNEAAASWASEYSFNLVSGLRTTSEQVTNREIQRLLQTEIPDFFESGLARRELEARLAPTFGPVRAEMIAVTEVTRAAAEGENQIAQQYAASEAGMVANWETNDDERVCPICAPLDGAAAAGYDGGGWPYWVHPNSGSRYDGPPAHPRCRCWVNWTFAETV